MRDHARAIAAAAAGMAAGTVAPDEYRAVMRASRAALGDVDHERAKLAAFALNDAGRA